MHQKTSIITPCFNNAGTLRETADSVFQQDHKQWEWIVVDNGSTDETSTLLNEWENDERVRVTRLPKNIGVSGGRNVGLENASGEFICFLDADDRLTAQSLSCRLELMEKDPEVSFVDGAVQRIDMLGNPLQMQRPEFTGNPFKELLSLSGKCFIGITWLIRRKEGVTYRFNESIRHGEDLLFFLSISDRGTYAFVDDVVYEYRTRQGSAMHDLEGLEKGYAALEEELGSWDQISSEQLNMFHRKWRKIMLKSYLKAGRINDALRLKRR